MRKIDLNCDIGERSAPGDHDLEKDMSILNYVSSVNIACGYHAGDAYTMHALVEAALEKGIAIGAHPSYPDRENFGRKNMPFTPSQVYDMVLYQLGALSAFAQVYGAKIHHLKPHGALYNMAARDRTLADAISLAMVEFDKEIMLYGLSGSELISAGRDHGITTCSEVFADRTYQDSGDLTSRSEPGAVVTELPACLEQVLMMVNEGKVKSTSDKLLPILAETVCLHSDNEKALAFAAGIYESLNSRNVLIQQP